MESDQKQLRIITFYGAIHIVDFVPCMTTGELKQTILSIDQTVSDFDFLYAGRMIRSNDKVLSDFIK
jgi:hypothetical protein